MEYYLAVRMRRYGRAFQPDPSSGRTVDRAHARCAGRDEPATGRWANAGHDARGRRRHLDQHGPIRESVVRPGARPLLANFQGTTRIALHRPGLGDSERRRLGRRRSYSERRCATGRRVDRDPASGMRLEAIQERTPRARRLRHRASPRPPPDRHTMRRCFRERGRRRAPPGPPGWRHRRSPGHDPGAGPEGVSARTA